MRRLRSKLLVTLARMDQATVVSPPLPARKLADSAGCGWHNLVAGLYREAPVADTFAAPATFRRQREV